jgi:hypothetical protein
MLTVWLTTERGWLSSLRDEGDVEKYLGWYNCLRGALDAVLVAWRASCGTNLDAIFGRDSLSSVVTLLVLNVLLVLEML